MGFPGKELVYQCRRQGFDPWVRKIPLRTKWKPILSILFFFFFSNILAWEIPRTEEASGLQSKWLQRVGNHSSIKTTTTERSWLESTCTPVWTCCYSLEGTGHPTCSGFLELLCKKTIRQWSHHLWPMNNDIVIGNTPVVIIIAAVQGASVEIKLYFWCCCCFC